MFKYSNVYAVTMATIMEYHREIISAGVGAMLMLLCQAAGGL